MIQGMMQIDSANYLAGAEPLLKLWLHEASRQFRDRLIDHDDRDVYDDVILEQMKDHVQDAESWTKDHFRTLVFGNYVLPDGAKKDQADKYTEIVNKEKLLKVLNEKLEEYKLDNSPAMNIVLFQDAQDHFSRTCRVSRQNRGNMLSVGVSGVGRKSMTRMAAFVLDYRTFSIEICRGYKSFNFKEDLKKLMNDVVVGEGKGITFLFSDTQIVEEGFLEDINNILNTGEVPNLFEATEAVELRDKVRPL
eukprot:gene1083-514_t